MVAGLDVQVRMAMASQIADVARPDAGLQPAYQQQGNQEVVAETIQSSCKLGGIAPPSREKCAKDFLPYLSTGGA